MLVVAPTALLTNWRAEHEEFIWRDIFRAVLSLHGSALNDYRTNERTPNGKKKLLLTLRAIVSR